MRHLHETSLRGLYDSAVRAFPQTTKRQHAVDPIEIETLRWTPFVGMKTLFVKGEARNEDRHYDTLILFKKIDYDKPGVVLHADGRFYQFAPISLEHNDVSVRCSCPDFRWRFNYTNSQDGSLYGRVRAPYESKGLRPPANPLELPGLCKHLLKTAVALEDAGLFG